MLTALIYGIVHGLSAIFPIGTRLHQCLLQLLSGQDGAEPGMLLLMDAAVLVGLVTGCQKYFVRLRRQQAGSRRRGVLSRQVIMSLIALSIGTGLLMYFTRNVTLTIPLAASLFFVNGLVLYISDRMPQGNKDFRNTTPLDTVLVGLSGALGAVNLSGIGCALSACRWRGMSRQYSLMLAMFLAMGIQVWSIVTDFLLLTSGAGLAFGNMLTTLAAAVCSFAATRMSIFGLQQLSMKTGYSCFSYYCWGAGLLLSILYLTV